MPRRADIEPAPKPSKRKSPPYPFVLEALDPLHPEVRPMFSGYAVYIGDKIVLMLRESPKVPQDNGLWLVFAETPGLSGTDITSRALKKEFPSLRPITILGGKINHWLLIPADHPSFETDAMHACDLLLAHDPRLGRIPVSRQSKIPKKRKPLTNH
jgi:hypothetical protein